MLPSLEVEHSKQIIVEGNDEIRIFQSLISYLNVSNIQIRHYGGVDNLRSFLRTFRTSPGFRDIRSLAIVADADSDRERRERRIRSALSDMSLPTPDSPLEIASDSQLKIAYLVIPHGRENGMIEDVCLDSISDDPAMDCIERYFECIGESVTSGPREVWSSKARLHAFLASRDRPDLRIGEAADAGVWNFDHESFLPLKDLLKSL